MKHFHEHLRREHGFRWGYTWVTTQLHASGLGVRAPRRGAHRRKRERKPCEGMMVHQDGSRAVWPAGQPALDLIVTMDDATSTIYSAFLVEEEGTASTFRGCSRCSASTAFRAASTPIAAAIISTPRRPARRSTGSIRRRSAGRSTGWGSSTSRPTRRRRAAARSGCSARRRTALIKEPAKADLSEIEAANRWIRQVYLPRHNARFARPAALADSGFVRAADGGSLAETLCIEEERVVDRANTVSFGRLKLQLPPSPLRAHYVKARARVRPLPRWRPGGVPWAALRGPLRRRWPAQAGRPDLRQRDIVLAAVKDAARRLRRWPAAILDRSYARCLGATAGRDEETAPRSNQETELRRTLPQLQPLAP